MVSVKSKAWVKESEKKQLEVTTMKQSIAVLTLVFFLAITGFATAKTIKCTVETVADNQVTLQCVDTEALQVGDKVKVKTAKKKAIEGC